MPRDDNQNPLLQFESEHRTPIVVEPVKLAAYPPETSRVSAATNPLFWFVLAVAVGFLLVLAVLSALR